MKDLTINGVIYAKYQINGNELNLEIVIPIIENNIEASEQYCCHLISLIEKNNWIPKDHF